MGPDLNVLKCRSLVTRLMGALADFSRNRADGIIALADDMKARLIARGIPEHKIAVAENYGKLLAPLQKGLLVVHYSSTSGLAHEEHTITEAMRQLRDDRGWRFDYRRQRQEEFCRARSLYRQIATLRKAFRCRSEFGRRACRIRDPDIPRL
jgi:hypothetical protein